LTASEAEIEAGMLYVLSRHHKLVEGAAGVSVAVAQRHANGVFTGCTLVVVCCGANLSVAKLRLLLDRHPDVQ
jgi:threonine dehydratase